MQYILQGQSVDYLTPQIHTDVAMSYQAIARFNFPSANPSIRTGHNSKRSSNRMIDLLHNELLNAITEVEQCEFVASAGVQPKVYPARVLPGQVFLQL